MSAENEKLVLTYTNKIKEFMLNTCTEDEVAKTAKDIVDRMNGLEADVKYWKGQAAHMGHAGGY